MLPDVPDEMWEEVLGHLELSDLARLKRVSKRWNEIITRVIKKASKWYDKCVAEIPEELWSSMLGHQTHPKIRCENFHWAKMHSEIWMTMYKSWIGWNTLMEKSTSIENIQIFPDEMIRSTAIFCSVVGNIVAAGTCNGHISFYDIGESTVNPIWELDDGAAIGNVVLCRNGNDVMAVSGSANDLRYWDLKTKKQIHQRQFSQVGRILTANFDYFYSLCYDDVDTWTFNVEQFVSGTVRLVRTATFTDAECLIKAMGTGGDKALLYMNFGERCNKFYVNLSDNKFVPIAVHEEVRSEMYMAISDNYRIFKPCVTTYVPRHSPSFGISVKTKPWKMYDLQQDLDITAVTSTILYHVGHLIVALEFGPWEGAEVCIYSIDDINNLDNLDFKSLKSKRLKFSSPCIDELFVTEYNSCQYLLAVGSKKIHVVKFD